MPSGLPRTTKFAVGRAGPPGQPRITAGAVRRTARSGHHALPRIFTVERAAALSDVFGKLEEDFGGHRPPLQGTVLLLVGRPRTKQKHQRPPDAIPPTAFIVRVPLDFEVQ